MYIGKIGEKICRTSIDAANQSVCLSGLSGSGKTTRLNLMELMQVKDGGTVIVLDVNMSHSDDRIFAHIKKDYLHAVNRVSILKDGMGDGLLPMLPSEAGNEEFVLAVNAAVQALSSAQSMGIRQIGTLRRIIIEAMRLRRRFKTEAETLEFVLSEQEGEIAEAVQEKFWTILRCGALKPASKTMQREKINIIDFSGADLITQSCLSEIFLSNLWRRVRTPDRVNANNVMVVLDEFQNLSLKRDATLPNLLREGRKFGVNLLLATQTLEIFPAEVLPMLNQTATKLYFRQTQNEARRIAKEIDDKKTTEWAKKLAGLRVGEAIAVGNICVDGREINRPLLLK